MRGQGLQKMVPCRVRWLCGACVQIFCLPELESRYSQTERLERQLHGTPGRAAAWPTQSGDELISTQAGAHNSHSPLKGACPVSWRHRYTLRRVPERPNKSNWQLRSFLGAV